MTGVEEVQAWVQENRVGTWGQPPSHLFFPPLIAAGAEEDADAEQQHRGAGWDAGLRAEREQDPRKITGKNGHGASSKVRRYVV